MKVTRCIMIFCFVLTHAIYTMSSEVLSSNQSFHQEQDRTKVIRSQRPRNGVIQNKSINSSSRKILDEAKGLIALKKTLYPDLYLD